MATDYTIAVMENLARTLADKLALTRQLIEAAKRHEPGTERLNELTALMGEESEGLRELGRHFGNVVKMLPPKLRQAIEQIAGDPRKDALTRNDGS